MSKPTPLGTIESDAEHESGPARIILVSYPKIVFMYPTFLVAVFAALFTTFAGATLERPDTLVSAINALFLGVWGVNMVVLAFDFPRTTSLTLFFLVAALAMAAVLAFTLRPEWLPWATAVLSSFHPAANATFYWTFVSIFAVIFAAVFVTAKFDYWEVRPNELLHHHGALSNLERFAAPNLRIDKEINDLFEFILLRSGRLIIHPSSEPRAIILDNVPFISRKEAQITRMLGALQVQVRRDRRGEQ